MRMTRFVYIDLIFNLVDLNQKLLIIKSNQENRIGDYDNPDYFILKSLVYISFKKI